MSQRSDPIQRAFSSGEVSPLLHGRDDFQRHQTGLAQCRGFIPLRGGGATRQPGTRYLGRTRQDAKARLIPFSFNDDDALVLEFSEQRMRVWRYGALVTSGGSPYELTTPFTWANVKALHFAQSADVIYLADGANPPQKLSRLALDNWTIAELQLAGGPVRALHAGSKTVQASAEFGTITLTASSSLFTSAQVGSLFSLTVENWDAVPFWTGNVNVSTGDRVRYDGRVYECTNAGGGNTGVNPPLHRQGRELSAADGVVWTYRSTDTGLVRITAVASGTSATAEVLDRIPSELTAAGTPLWREGAFSAKHGYPAAVTFFDERLWFGGTRADPRAVWASTLGAYEDFAAGEVDQAISYTLAGGNGRDRIVWMQPSQRELYVGTRGGVHTGRSTVTQEAISTENATFSGAAGDGQHDAQPIAVDGRPIAISRDRRRVFEFRYVIERDAVEPLELSLPAEHLGADRFERIAWQTSPLRMAWIPRDGGGDPVVMVYEQNEDVLGWAPLSFAGGAIEDIAVTPGLDGDDDLLLIVRRTIGGATVRHVEQVSDWWGLLTGDIDIAAAEHLFACKVYDPDGQQKTFGQLDHLEGEQVHAWTDEGQMGPYTVSGAQITLERQVGRAVIGLQDDTHVLRTLPRPAQTRSGGGMGQPEKIAGYSLHLHRTAGLRAEVIGMQFGRNDIRTGPRVVGPDKVPGDLTDGWSGWTDVPGGGQALRAAVIEVKPLGAAPLTLLGIAPTKEAMV